MPDTQILCLDCGQEFTFTEAEASWFQQKGFTPPKRCKSCRAKRKATQKSY